MNNRLSNPPTVGVSRTRVSVGAANKVLLTNQQRTDSIHASRLTRLTSDARQRKARTRPCSAIGYSVSSAPTGVQKPK